MFLQLKTNHLTEIYDDLCASKVPPIGQWNEMEPMTGFSNAFIRWTLSMAISWIDVGFNSDLSEMFSACQLLATIPISLEDVLPSRSEFWCQISKSNNQNEQMTCPSSWLHSSGGVLYICGIILRSTVSNEARQMATRQGPEISIWSWFFHILIVLNYLQGDWWFFRIPKRISSFPLEIDPPDSWTPPDFRTSPRPQL